jgi:hypothetical protein
VLVELSMSCFPQTDAKTLAAFMANFSAKQQVVPSIAGTIFAKR